MNRRRLGTWYLVPQGWQRQPDDAMDDGIEEIFEYGRSYLRGDGAMGPRR